MRHDRLELRGVESADAVHLFHEAAVALHEARIERVLLLEPVEIAHRDAGVEVVRACGEQIPARRRRLRRHRGIDGRVEEEWLHSRQHGVDRLAAAQRNVRAGAHDVVHRARERLRRARGDELARGEVVVRPGVDPEELRVAFDGDERLPVRDGVAVTDDGLEQIAHLEVVGIALVVKDVAAGNRGLREVPDEDLLALRQVAEAVGVQLDDSGFADALEEVWPADRGRRGRDRRRRMRSHGRHCQLAYLTGSPRAQ